MSLNIEAERQRLENSRKELLDIRSGNVSIPASKKDDTNVSTILTGKLRIASIMDDFTFACYSPECDLLRITPNNWEKELTSFNPQLFFIESAWEGVAGLWKRKVSNLSEELTSAISWCKKKGVPVVFWNKEDPVHFDTFLNTAKLADVIFTTDIDCIPKYKGHLRHENIFLLPFAAQPAIHNPIEKYERKDKFCFAGAYYSRYAERQKDFENFTNVCLLTKGLDIYDRKQNDSDPRYSFPDAYKSLIVGSLPPERIDEAYKGYKYSLNMNSIKQSQTMFARRVFELLASNTLVLSNYSRGIKNFFGNIVICTDNPEFLKNQFEETVRDQDKFDKLRLAGLRKTLAEHTYGHRLAYVVNKSLNQVIKTPLDEHIGVISFVNNDEEAKWVVKAFRSQTYPNKRLFIFHPGGARIEPTTDTSISISSIGGKSDLEIIKLVNANYVAYFSPANHYGKNYLLDLRLAFTYAKASLIGKSCHYGASDNNIIISGRGLEYKHVEKLPLSASMIDLNRYLEISTLGDLINRKMDEQIVCDGFSIDRFNFCMNCGGTSDELVDDLDIVDTGIGISDLLTIGEKIKPQAIQQKMILSSKQIINGLSRSKDGKVKFSLVGESLVVESRLADDEKQYLNLKFRYDIEKIQDDGVVNYYLDATPGLNLSIVSYFNNRSGTRLDHNISAPMRGVSHKVPEGCKEIIFGLRVQGGGTCTVGELRIGGELNGLSCYVPKSKSLLLTNQYPSYDNLYRNGFIHRRVHEYQERGYKPDVITFHPNNREQFSEYLGIDIASGHSTTLEKMLEPGHYREILIHFLDPEMWSIVAPHLNDTKIFIWVHGAEVQPWYRREFNYSNEDEKKKAQLQSDIRVEFWRRVLSVRSDNLHFIFVSKYFAHEVMEDIGVELESSQFSIIHNFIDTNLFNYYPKTPEHRFKILSIRPYASRKYANDLSVKTIVELSKRPIFNKLNFLLIGDGPLFEDTNEPVQKFKNVIIQRRFVPQEEIPDLHQQYGVFLVPTRMDSQGVSRDEAMSSGLIPITNAVTAIPEFVDDSCGILAPPEDFVVMANGIESLAKDPKKFLKMSKAAADRVRGQSSMMQTIVPEINLIWGIKVKND